MQFSILSITTIITLLFCFSVEAKLNGKNVVLVHGLQTAQLKDGADLGPVELQKLADENWAEYWAERSEVIFYWSAIKRVTGVIKDQMHEQFKSLEAAGTCLTGCVFVTHSMGDLVLRDALSRFDQWGIKEVKVLAVIDLLGAGGGSEMADTTFNIAEGNGIISEVQRAAVSAFLGFDLIPERLGALHDARPSTARAIATGNSAVPRLRFAGTGWQFLGITKPFISGYDDGVVPLHSACGAIVKGKYKSCSPSVRANGQVRYTKAAPSAFLFNHYPVLMGDKVRHLDGIINKPRGYLTTVVDNATNNATLGSLNIDFETRTGKRRFWHWFKRRWVKDSHRKSLSANIYDALNN